MGNLDRVTNYINNIKIKKAIFGGYDREDVYMKFSEIVDVFKDYLKDEKEIQDNQRKQIEEELEEQRAQVNAYKAKVREMELLVTELNLKISELMKEQTVSEKEKEKMKEVYKGYCSNILQQYSDSLRSLSTEFSNVLENISKLQQNIIEMDNFENLEVHVDELEEKETFELPDLGIDIDEWLREEI